MSTFYRKLVSREAGTVLVSHDRGRIWSKLANEEGICQQPGFTVLDKDRVFVTWSMSPIPRKTYGKVFYVHEGWECSETQLIYASPNTAYHDAADPSCALLPNGKVLIVSYDTPYQAIVGVFEDPEDAKYGNKEQFVPNDTWKLGHSLNLASDISVNLTIPKTYLEGFDLSTVYVESVLEVYKDNEKTGTETVRIEPVDKGYFYYFTLSGMTAVQMNDRISSTLYGVKDGQRYCSPVDNYAVADYAYSQLNKVSVSNVLKTLCADLLRYGTKAQVFKGYRTDSLADANMTEDHRAYLSDMESVSFGNTNWVLNDLQNAPITWAGKTLDLASKVTLKFIFSLGNYTGELSDLVLRVRYEDSDGKTENLIVSQVEAYNASYGLYAYSLDSLLAAELRTVLSVQIFRGDTPVSATLQYSADTYGNNKTGELLELCKALFAYSDSAKNFFVG